jgi:hypothetical protein
VLFLQNEDESSDEDSKDQDNESSDEDRTDEDDDSSDEEEEDTRTNRVLALLQLRRQRLTKLGMVAYMFGTYYIDRFMVKGEGGF